MGTGADTIDNGTPTAPPTAYHSRWQPPDTGGMAGSNHFGTGVPHQTDQGLLATDADAGPRYLPDPPPATAALLATDHPTPVATTSEREFPPPIKQTRLLQNGSSASNNPSKDPSPGPRWQPLCAVPRPETGVPRQTN